MSDPRIKKVAFIIPPTGLYCREDRCQSLFDPKLIPTVRAPLEECEAAGAVRSAGGAAMIIDAPVLKLSVPDVIAKVRCFDPDLAVVTLTFGSLEADLQFISELKTSLPNLKVGVRGAPCYVWTEKLLGENKTIDYCLSGDYELCLADLIMGCPEPRGVSQRIDSKIIAGPPAYTKDLSTLPSPDRSSLDHGRYKVRLIRAPQATIRVQRGCPFPCTYCLVHTVSGPTARHRSPADIAAEAAELMSAGIRHFYFRAETFSVNRRWVLQLCDELIKRCPGIYWVTTTRVECVDEEVLSAMKAAGCYGISFGIDVGSELIASKVKKPLNFKVAENAMRLCDQVGIISLAYIMIGFVWDTPDTLAETKKFILSLSPDLITVHYAHPYPGTGYYDTVKNTLDLSQINSHGAQAEPATSVGNLSSKELAGWGRSILRAHYWRPRTAWSVLRKLLLKRRALCSAALAFGMQTRRLSRNS